MSNKPNVPANGTQPRPLNIVAMIKIALADDGRMKIDGPEDPVVTLHMLTDAMKIILQSGKVGAKEVNQVEVVNPLQLPKSMMGRG